ncbi:hypothetical protein CYMTET_7646 [Cymbomonas tetramitiformis]|uniref:Uncharacterized protein n=1 Tax=Cymbomonas tetramitiformis TaxID=36881 RepID=A0AAE0LGT3_9CHLO|nr:hypothetical protein CYMTET_57013 [Cymbomonas tetramitiformis]KAK3284718.1 hypothetical protein CYMTET_7646 [Cymbomonas tetramitiformis]
MPPPVTRSFADFIASTGFTVEAPGEPPTAMNTMLSATREEPESATGYAASISDDEGYPPEQPPAGQPPPRFGCGRTIPALFVISTGRWYWTGCLSSPNHGDTAA